MNAAAARQPTETELKAHRRRAAFRQSIAEKAAALNEKMEAAPKAVAAQVDPPVAEVLSPDFPPLQLSPMKKPWFKIEGVTAPAPLRVSQIQEVVCAAYGVNMNDMTSARRTAKLVLPRQVAMYLAKVMTGRSLPEIGRRFGGRDHTTVLHAVRKIEAIVDFNADPELCELLNALRADIEARRGE
ncbi:helix-turn-helix domain-containing protein [Bradyrhizobium retamae]|uniref:Chromosomal replication initiator DnaA C-terminal domain-containing protein n=1 Tax=Bradyrhizobium retamae TaxID=1300035 RepID=A0A0R3MUL6_9BRAD|nr:hypothetical protein CQ13_07580 [Bradyrhizobium retamae]